MGDSWFLLHSNNQWQLTIDCNKPVDAQLFIKPDIAWKLFSKSIRPEQVKDKIGLSGDLQLAATALNMASVMA